MSRINVEQQQLKNRMQNSSASATSVSNDGVLAFLSWEALVLGVRRGEGCVFDSIFSLFTLRREREKTKGKVKSALPKKERGEGNPHSEGGEPGFKPGGYRPVSLSQVD